MAKQTFTTGSVLTATQMNNLQANDYNWTVSQKTASYVLVAADAGTRIEMNAAGATTITVNTGLFAAGDTLFIQNIGAGATTITAGTATVNKATAGSLTLAQYQGGTLYFVSASSAVFFADAGYTPPLTTKGDLFGYDTAAARIPIGSNNQVLTADSTQALGLKWATPSGSMTLLSTTSLSGTTTTISSISGSYKHLFVEIDAYAPQSAGTDNPCFRVNGLSTSIYCSTGGAPQAQGRFSQMNIGNTASNSQNYFQMTFWNYANTTVNKSVSGSGAAYEFTTSRYETKVSDASVALTSAINSLSIFHGSAASINLTGTVRIYGVN